MIASNLITILLDKRHLLGKNVKGWMGKITGVRIACNQLERYLFAFAANENGNMWLLNAFGLIDCPTNLVKGALKTCLIFCPHGFEDLEGLSKLTKARWHIGIGIAIGVVFRLIPP